MNYNRKFSADVLKIDAESVTNRIGSFLKKEIINKFRKQGFVLGLSGGIDSSVVAALCVNAVGNNRVLGLLMPERESSPDTLVLGRLMADFLGIQTIHIDITAILEAVECYRIRDDAIRTVIPDYTSDHKCKLVLPNILEKDTYSLFSIVVQSPNGKQEKKRLPKAAYLSILASSNFKQRVRKMLEYYHADKLEYAVAGTPNRLEYDQGFFVKLGDGAADTKPIAHLYKSQVYELAEYFGVPDEIRERPSTTDTYPLPQSQEEFYFSLPHHELDLCLFAKNHEIPAKQVAEVTGLSVDQVERVYREIASKRRATKYLHAVSVLVEELPEVEIER